MVISIPSLPQQANCSHVSDPESSSDCCWCPASVDISQMAEEIFLKVFENTSVTPDCLSTGSEALVTPLINISYHALNREDT